MESCNENVMLLLNWLKKDITEENVATATAFLSLADNDIQKTMQNLTNIFTLKKQCSSMFSEVDIALPQNMKILNRGIFVTDISRGNISTPVVVIVKISRIDVDNDIYGVFSLLMLGAMTIILQSSRMKQHGVNFIIDMGELPYRVVLKCTPTFFYQAFKCALGIFGDLLHEIHCVNTGIIAGKIIKAARLLLPKHVNDLVHVHMEHWKTLSEGNVAPVDSLPEEFGGTNGTLEENNDVLRRTLLLWRNNMVEFFSSNQLLDTEIVTY